jgi:hypothetical protein
MPRTKQQILDEMDAIERRYSDSIAPASVIAKLDALIEELETFTQE